MSRRQACHVLSHFQINALLRSIVLCEVKGACQGQVSSSGLLACQGQLYGEMQLSVILDFGGDIELTTVNLFNQFGMLLFVEGVHLEQNNAYDSTKSR